MCFYRVFTDLRVCDSRQSVGWGMYCVNYLYNIVIQFMRDVLV